MWTLKNKPECTIKYNKPSNKDLRTDVNQN